jgi:hypothetical protein
VNQRIKQLERLTQEQAKVINILAGQLKALRKDVDELRSRDRANP